MLGIYREHPVWEKTLETFFQGRLRRDEVRQISHTIPGFSQRGEKIMKKIISTLIVLLASVVMANAA